MKFSARYLFILLAASAPLFSLPRVPLAQVSRSCNEFALALYKEIMPGDSNKIYCPYALSSAMSLAYLGARGTTESQIKSYFFFPLTPNYMGESFKLIQEKLSTDPALGLASSLWVQSGLKLTDDFKSRVSNYYEGQFFEGDFAGRPDSARFEMNRWVSERTRKKIPFLLGVSDLPAGVKMYLIAVATLQAEWESPFSSRATKMESFFLTTTAQIKAPMMEQELDLPFYQDDKVKVVEIPFAQEEGQLTRLGFWVVVPLEVEGLKKLESELSAEQFNEWIARVGRRRVSLKLPRFRVNQVFDFKGVLEGVGLKLPFSKEADFSGMTPSTGVSIGKIYQKIFFAINEKGSNPQSSRRAAKAKAKLEAKEGVVEEVSADRPFMFFIYDNYLGQILFMGRCIQP